MLRNTHLWLPAYVRHQGAALFGRGEKPSHSCHILFSICDHFEPFWNNVDRATAYRRVSSWIENYPDVARRHRDCLGIPPRHTFFYPIEEYEPDLMGQLEALCHKGFGEVEIHLHHDNDNSENLASTLDSYKRVLYKDHGLLSTAGASPDIIRYGFIHGDWALDNSRPDGLCCGVNNEITVLQQTGCYADFTMPSAPSDTQTRTINSIYYATDDPERPKSHDCGIPAKAGVSANGGLLCIQGPLALNFRSRKLCLLPRIENGALSADNSVTTDRIWRWVKQSVHVKERPDIIFVKVYTHGAQDDVMEFFFRQGQLDRLFSLLESFCEDEELYKLYYVTPRQMYNVVKGLEAQPNAHVEELLSFELVLQ
jgi:hypothetical protein